MTTDRGAMAQAVADALGTAQIQPVDAGAVALARQYAALIDEAAPKASYADALDKLAAALAEASPATKKALRTVAVALGAHSVASDLGPKLLAVLQQLAMTPAARGVREGGGSVDPVADVLDELRARRESRDARAHGA